MSYDDVCKSALALSPAERLNLMLLLGESMRKPLDAPKPKRKSKAKEAAAEGAAAAGGGGGEEKPKKSNAWQTGLAAVRVHLKSLEAKGSLAMKLGGALKSLPSWPAPTLAEVETALEDIPEEDRMSAASKPSSKGSTTKGSKGAAAAGGGDEKPKRKPRSKCTCEELMMDDDPCGAVCPHCEAKKSKATKPKAAKKTAKAAADRTLQVWAKQEAVDVDSEDEFE
jgi:hypothetical protein